MSERADALEAGLSTIKESVASVDSKLDTVAAFIEELKNQTPAGEPTLVTEEQFARLEGLVTEIKSSISSVDTEAGGLVSSPS